MKTYLGLGSNLGDKERNIQSALQLIAERAGVVLRISSHYYSAPQGFESDNHFVNVVASVETSLQPLELLSVLQQIETELGRTSKSKIGQYADRIIDIDILLYGDLVIDLPELKIPHPLMKTRDFVIKPLNEILGLT